VITTLLPALGYLTLFDWYIMFNISFIFFCMLCNVTVNLYGLGKDANATLGTVATVLLLVVNLIFSVHIVLYVKPMEAAKLTTIPSDGGALGREKKIVFETMNRLTHTKSSNKGDRSIFYGRSSAPFATSSSDLAGVWWSPDYSSASREKETEFMHVSITHSDEAPPCLIITKITGDENVAAGKVTVKADGVPVPGGQAVPASIALAAPGGKGEHFHPGKGIKAISMEHLVFELQGKPINYYRLLKEKFN